MFPVYDTVGGSGDAANGDGMRLHGDGGGGGGASILFGYRGYLREYEYSRKYSESVPILVSVSGQPYFGLMSQNMK